MGHRFLVVAGLQTLSRKGFSDHARFAGATPLHPASLERRETPLAPGLANSTFELQLRAWILFQEARVPQALILKSVSSGPDSMPEFRAAGILVLAFRSRHRIRPRRTWKIRTPGSASWAPRVEGQKLLSPRPWTPVPEPPSVPPCADSGDTPNHPCPVPGVRDSQVFSRGCTSELFSPAAFARARPVSGP